MINDFHSETNDTVKNLLNELNQNRKRVRIWYGDIKTGKSWNDEHDIIGYIGCSTGQKKIPLLVHNSRSLGGGHLLDHCIIRIDDIKAKKTLYKHDNFHIDLETCSCLVRKESNKEVIAAFKTDLEAEKFLDFMTGNRYSK